MTELSPTATAALPPSVFDALTEGVLVVGREGTIRSTNPAAARLFGVPHPELVGLPVTSTAWRTTAEDGTPIPPERRPAVRTLRTREPVSGERIEILAADGMRRWCEVRTLCTPWADDPDAVVALYRDLTTVREVGAQLAARDAELRALFDQAPVGIFLSDAGGTFGRKSNATLDAILGTDASWTEGTRWREFVHPDDLEPFLAAVSDAFARQRGYDGDLRLRRPTGEIRHVAVRSAPLRRSEREAPFGFVATLTDITELVTTRRDRDLFFELSNEMLAVGDLDGRLWRVNPTFAATLGVSVDDLQGRRFLDLLHPDDREALRAAGDQLAAGEDVVDVLGRMRHADGTWRWLSWRMPAPPPGHKRLYAVARDVTAQRAADERLAAQALQDPLTGLANRAAFFAELDAALASSTHPAAVAFVDLDGFKAVNDALGHSTGDAVLREVARRLRERVRGHDVPARIGGDEFTVLLRELRDPAVGPQLGAQLAEAIGRIELDGAVVRGSVGVAVALPGEVDGAELVHRADRAMYRAKRSAAGWAVWGPDDG